MGYPNVSESPYAAAARRSLIDDAEADFARQQAQVRRPAARVPWPPQARAQASFEVTRNERTYHRGNDPRGTGFLRDVTRSFLFRDADAQSRLDAHLREERVERGELLTRAAGDSTTANWAGLTVPQYLTDMYAPAIAAMRPFADICNHHLLPPSGMTINISLVTTPAQVGIPATELPAAGVAAQTIDDTLLTENVQTAAGQVTLSRQAIDRGTGIEEVVLQDLYKRYATNLDNTLINQAGNGLAALATTTGLVISSGLTVQTLYSKIMGGASSVEVALLAQATPSHVLMYPSRWWWLASQVSNNFPFINVMGPQMPWQAGYMDPSSSYATGVRGRLPSGLMVVSDANIPNNLGASSNQDEIFIVAADECHLWEPGEFPSQPVFIRAEQAKAAELGVLLVLYSYFAYSFRRYSGASAAVSGAALTPPAF
jgi:hypothetical protein